jgi:hypothetical protein
MDSVYRERAHLVAYLAALHPSALVRGADPAEPDWPVLFVDLPTGQACWHISPDDMDLFKHVPTWDAGSISDRIWDGHTTDEKYARLDALTARHAAGGV